MAERIVSIKPVMEAHPVPPFPGFEGIYGIETGSITPTRHIVYMEGPGGGLYATYGTVVDPFSTPSSAFTALGTAGGLIILAHHVFAGSVHWTSSDMTTYYGNYHLVEWATASGTGWRGQFDNALAALARGENLYVTAASDAHNETAYTTNKVHALYYVTERSWQALITAGKMGRTIACFDKDFEASAFSATPIIQISGDRKRLTLYNPLSVTCDIEIYGVSGGTPGTLLTTLSGVSAGGTATYDLPANDADAAAIVYIHPVWSVSGTRKFLTAAVKIGNSGDDNGKFIRSTCPYVSLPEGGEWVHVQGHCHSIFSDGWWSPDMVRHNYYEAGYDATIITDHDRLTRELDVLMAPGSAADETRATGDYAADSHIGFVASSSDGVGLYSRSEVGSPAVMGVNLSEEDEGNFDISSPAVVGFSRRGPGIVGVGQPGATFKANDSSKATIKLATEGRNIIELCGGVDEFGIKNGAGNQLLYYTQYSNAIAALSLVGKLQFREVDLAVVEAWNSYKASVNLYAGEPVALVYDAGAVKLAPATATADNLYAVPLGLMVSDFTAGSGSYPTFVTHGFLIVSNWTSVVGSATLSVGSRYYLSTTAGQLTTTAPSGSGNVVVQVGVAVDTTKMYVNIVRLRVNP